MDIRITATDDAAIPTYATSGSAGFDLSSAADVTINPGHWIRVPTGLRFAIPAGFEMQIRSRSGIAYRDGLIVHQGVGTIDSDYRGEVFVVLRNVGLEARTVRKGQRIAQGVIAEVCTARFMTVSRLRSTDRADGGFGSTGE